MALAFSLCPTALAATSPGQDGVFHTLVQDGDEFVLTAPDQTSHRFDALGRLIAMQDRHGNTITINRNGDGQVTSIVDSAGRTFDVTYDGDFISSITDPLGRTVSYAHDGDGNLLAVTDGNGGVYQFQYSGRLLTQVTNPKGDLQDAEYLRWRRQGRRPARRSRQPYAVRLQRDRPDHCDRP